MKKRVCLMMALGMFLAAMLCAASGCGNAGMKQTSETGFFAMDTYMSVRATGKTSQEAIGEVQEAILLLEKKLSVTDPESLVSSLNAKGSCNADEDLTYLLAKSEEAKTMTDGAFNICIYPIMRAWGFTGEEYRVPGKEELEALCENLRNTVVRQDNLKQVIELSPNAMVDFGGIAKGYATLIAVKVLKECGIESALINLGGNVYALGEKTEGKAWTVAVRSPDDPNEYLGTLSLKDRAAITSGGYERYFEKDNVTYHHIIDPDTGYPAASGAKSVTIISEDPVIADALSTALFVMGLDKSVALWRENGELFDFIYFDTSNNLYVTDGLGKEFSSRKDYVTIRK